MGRVKGYEKVRFQPFPETGKMSIKMPIPVGSDKIYIVYLVYIYKTRASTKKPTQNLELKIHI